MAIRMILCGGVDPRGESEADVVGSPVALFVAQNWLEERDGFRDDDRTHRLGNRFQDASAEGVEPAGHAGGGQRGRPGDELDPLDGEAVTFKARLVSGGGRIVVGRRSVGQSVACQHGRGSHLDGGDIAVAAHLGDKAPAGAKRAPDAGHHGVVIDDPVQDGVGKDGVELLGKGQRLGVAHARVDSAAARRLEHRWRGVHADDVRARGRDLRGQLAVAATQIEDALARLRGEPLQDARAQGGDEASVFSIGSRAPCLCHRKAPPVQFSRRALHKASLLFLGPV